MCSCFCVCVCACVCMYVCMRLCLCVCAGGRQKRASPQGALYGALDKDSLGNSFSLVLRHSSVILRCQVTICHETTHKKKKKERKKMSISPCFGSFIWGVPTEEKLEAALMFKQKRFWFIGWYRLTARFALACDGYWPAMQYVSLTTKGRCPF